MTGCAGTRATAPTQLLVGLGEIGTRTWVARQGPEGTAFYLCFPDSGHVTCESTSVDWRDEARPPEVFEPAPPEPEPAPALAPEPPPDPPVLRVPE